MKRTITLIIFAITLLVMTSCGNNETWQVARRDFYNYLNTISYVYVEYDKAVKTANVVNQELAKIGDILKDIEATFSISKTANMNSDSLLMKINQEAGYNSIELNEDMLYVLNKAVAMANVSNGGFEPTIGPLTTLWKISEKTQYCAKDYSCPDPALSVICQIPSSEEIDAAKSLVDYQKIKITDNQISMDAGMKLDLGSIAKGYAADKVAEYLKSMGYHFALVNLGGNSLMYGHSYTNPQILTHLQNPMGEGSIVTLEVYDASVVTSAISERYYIYDYQYYHHLLNPKTGYPFDNEIVSVTIITKLSVEADGYSTVVFSLGLEDGLALVKNSDGVEAIIVTKDYVVHSTVDVAINDEFLGVYTLKKYL